jgi:hypothetical protein
MERVGKDAADQLLARMAEDPFDARIQVGHDVIAGDDRNDVGEMVGERAEVLFAIAQLAMIRYLRGDV